MPPMTKVWTGSAVRPRTSHPFNMLKVRWGDRTPRNQSPAIVATWVATKAAITALFPALLPIRYLTPESDSSISSPARGRLAILYNLSEGGDLCSAAAWPIGLRPLRTAAPRSGSTQPLYHRLPVSAAMTDVESRGLFIGGGFVPSSSGKTFPVYDPHTDEDYAKVAEAGTADVDAAGHVAREAFDGPWSALAPKERGRLLLKLARMLQEHGEALAQVE